MVARYDTCTEVLGVAWDSCAVAPGPLRLSVCRCGTGRPVASHGMRRGVACCYSGAQHRGIVGVRYAHDLRTPSPTCPPPTIPTTQMQTSGPHYQTKLAPLPGSLALVPSSLAGPSPSHEEPNANRAPFPNLPVPPWYPPTRVPITIPPGPRKKIPNHSHHRHSSQPPLPTLPTKHPSPVSHSHGPDASELFLLSVFLPGCSLTRTPPPLPTIRPFNLYFSNKARSSALDPPSRTFTPPPPSSHTDRTTRKNCFPVRCLGWPNHSGPARPSSAAALFLLFSLPPPRPRGGLL